MTAYPTTAAGAAGFSVSVADVAATAAVFGRTHGAAAQACGAASGALSAVSGMGGDDPLEARWRSRYDALSRAAWSACAAAVATLHDIAARLVETGDAYLAADHASTPDRSGGPAVLPAVGAAAPVPAGPPLSTGPVRDPGPVGFGGYWPGADPELLRRAAAVWSGLADALDDAALAADRAFRGLLAHNRGAGFSAMASFWSSRYVVCGAEPLFNVAPAGARTLGRNCEQLAGLVESTRRTMADALADAERNTAPLELLGLIPGSAGRVGAVVSFVAAPIQAAGFVQIARQRYLDGLDELTAGLFPELEGRLDRAARFPAPRDTPGLTVADVGEVVGLGLTGSGWDGVAGPVPTPDSINVPEGRKVHILDGDSTGGGHLSGTGKPNKSEFPPNWGPDRILWTAQSIARDPHVPPVFQTGPKYDSWKIEEVRDGILIRVIVKTNGELVTAVPLEGPGVIRNPK